MIPFGQVDFRNHKRQINSVGILLNAYSIQKKTHIIIGWKTKILCAKFLSNMQNFGIWSLFRPLFEVKQLIFCNGSLIPHKDEHFAKKDTSKLDEK